MSETATNGSTSGDARHCRLRVTAGLSNVSIQVGADMDGFLQARFRGEVPRVDVDGQRLPSVGSALHWKSPGFHPDQAHYALDVSGGVSGVTVDTR
jgi:hypothetical protein